MGFREGGFHGLLERHDIRGIYGYLVRGTLHGDKTLKYLVTIVPQR